MRVVTAVVLDGDLVAATVREDLARRVERLNGIGVTPGLGTLLVGDDGPSATYVQMKHDDARALGIHTRELHESADMTADEVAVAIDTLNHDPAVHAFIVQYPFPPGLDYGGLILGMDPAKDADGLHPTNLGLLVMGQDAPLACTPAGILKLLEHYEVPIAGRHVVVVGRGLTIGRPLTNLLALKRPDANAAVTVVHTGVADIAAFTRTADIVVAAAGSPGMITAEMVKPGAAVVAAGVSFEGRKVVSDVADEVSEVAGWLSPRIGGVGPMTRIMLMANTIAAAERASGIRSEP
jgi:methylenetetrahydrofolate dehydrogenase (NADP+)/methenyltetrahydrofolate cyclohydrolase